MFFTETQEQAKECMKMTKINYSTTEEFNKDFKKLLKRYKSLEEDLALLKTRILEPFHIGVDSSDTNIIFINPNAIKLIPGFENEQFKLYKITKFVCKSIKNRGSQPGIRLIYAFYETESSIELIQLYFKADSENMDYERARKYMREIISNQKLEN